MIDPLEPIDRQPLRFEDKDLIVLCEGNDEAAVVRALLPSAANLKCGKKERGQSEFDEMAAIPGQAQARGESYVLCLMFDAEDSRSKRNEQIKTWLDEAGLNLPGSEGCFKETVNNLDAPGRGRLWVGYLINPPGRDRGKLEDLFLPQIEAHEFGECAAAFVKCAQGKNSDESREKLLLRSYIACFNAVNTIIQSGIQKQAFDLQATEFAALREFLDEAVRIRLAL